MHFMVIIYARINCIRIIGSVIRNATKQQRQGIITCLSCFHDIDGRCPEKQSTDQAHPL